MSNIDERSTSLKVTTSAGGLTSLSDDELHAAMLAVASEMRRSGLLEERWDERRALRGLGLQDVEEIGAVSRIAARD